MGISQKKVQALAAILKRGELKWDGATLEAHAGDKWFASPCPK